MTKRKSNLWILTEERPKTEVLCEIFSLFAEDRGCGFFGDTIRIIPLLDESGAFCFTYEVVGFTCASIERVYIKSVSGSSSFTDFLIFYQEHEPTQQDQPLYAIEETKTADKESRNTGVFQRCSKFVYLQNYYPSTKMVMLYSLQIAESDEPTQTNIFGSRLLKTFGVEIRGKANCNFEPFVSIDELVAFKNTMRQPPKGNTPIAITKTDNKIQISGRLYKSGALAHDPNIGALSIIAAVIRKLGWSEEIEITLHALQQEQLHKSNKFVVIANNLGLTLENLTLPKASMHQDYWHYEVNGEKLGTIFIHIVVENFTRGYSIFENHAGCEKGYFITSSGECIALQKYADRERYKAGDKSQIVYIPDLVLIDIKNSETIIIEGKKYRNKEQGIAELNNYDSFEKLYLRAHYGEYHVVKTVVLYGSENEVIGEVEIGFLLNSNGKLILGVQAPKLFREAITNLLDYWK